MKRSIRRVMSGIVETIIEKALKWLGEKTAKLWGQQAKEP
jgi:hypothetical protein